MNILNWVLCIVPVSWWYNEFNKLTALVNGYTFYGDKNCTDLVSMWRCTKGYPCKARFKAIRNGEIVKATTLEHTHEPPNFSIENGILIKIRTEKRYVETD